ncbi:ThiF family adenylyltransferase [Rhodanobacter umsongensis]
MKELTLTASDWNILSGRLLHGPTEACAILFTRQVERDDGLTRLLTCDMLFPSPEDYARQGHVEAELTPGFVARVTKLARRTDCGLVFVHSHPGTNPPRFSRIDDTGEVQLSAFLAHRHPRCHHAALVISEGGVSARELGKSDTLRVIALGATREVLFDPSVAATAALDVFDRQVRAFGKRGQQALQGLRVGIVGLGGTGSIVLEQLAHLGVRRFLLIDPDTLEISNLNRVVGARPECVGEPKTTVAERLLRAINPQAQVDVIQDDVIRARVARTLANTDLFFGCTDSHGSRAVLQQIAYQYLIPYIDVGTVIAADQSGVTHVAGRAQLLAPGLACLTCGGLLNSDEVRRDMMNEFERAADPYLLGAREPAPAVISINGATTSLAVTMLLAVVAGVPGDARHVLYDAIRPQLRSIRAEPAENCYVCSKNGALAQGDSWPLMARQD